MRSPAPESGWLVPFSIWLHVAAALVLLLKISWWPWVLALLLTNHVLLCVCSVTPRCGWLGPNLSRLNGQQSSAGRVVLTFDDGPDPGVTPHVLQILNEHRAQATFFCVGDRASNHPEIVRQLVAAGHHVENHTQRHPVLFGLFGPRAMGREVDHAQGVLTAIAGSPPQYFRAPAGMRNPWLSGVLTSRGLHLVSWTRRGFDTVAKSPTQVVQRLTSKLRGGEILLLHDGNSPKSKDGQPIVLETLPRLLAELERQGLRAVALPRTASDA